MDNPAPLFVSYERRKPVLALLELRSSLKNGHPSKRFFEMDWQSPLPKIGTPVGLGENIRQGEWINVYIRDAKLYLTVQTEGAIDQFHPPEEFRELVEQ